MKLAIFEFMDGLDNKFLQKVNLEALQKETGMSLVELAELAKIGPKVIYKWRYMHKDSSRPDYNAIVRLLEKGATVETLFGVDYKPNKLVQNSAPSIPPELSNDPDFQKGLQQSIDAKVSATVKTELEKILKQKGLL